MQTAVVKSEARERDAKCGRDRREGGGLTRQPAVPLTVGLFPAVRDGGGNERDRGSDGGRVAQKRPIMVGGNWWFGGLSTDITNFQWSTAPYPGSDDTLGSGGNHWVIPTKAKNKKLAEDFIAITMSNKIQKLIGEKGNIPLVAKPDDITNPKSRQLINAFAQSHKNGGLSFYPDWPVTGYYDTWVAATQNLMNGGKPDTVLDELAGPYEKYLATRP